MEPLQKTGPADQAVPGYYVWQVPGSPMIHLDLEVVDRLLNEALTGFGAIPRRGAEVGGILIGAIENGIVRIDDFQPVPCEYKRGPSYQLSEADQRAFDDAYQVLKPAPGLTTYAVGYYRSNTREAAVLGDEDREICQRYFPPPANVVLLIKPYTTKVSTAGFLTYQNGKLPDTSPLEFPLRRWELAGEQPPARRPLGEARPRSSERPARAAAPPPSREAENFFGDPPPPTYVEPESVPEPEAERPYAVTAGARAHRQRSWVWFPLSFIFLLFGVLLGFLAAVNINPHSSTNSSEDAYSVSLAVTENDDSLHVRWDRQAPAIRAAERGVLEITDGNNPTKIVDLSTTTLKTGSVIYRHLTPAVRFRLQLFMKGHTVVTENINWPE